jgi:hypothetical protein
MENPACWGEAERIIRRVRTEYEASRQAGRIGLSLEMQITMALREAGLLHERGEAR